MKRLFTILIFLFANALVCQNLIVTCQGQDVIEKDTHPRYDKIIFENCGATLLMQDSSTIKIHRVEGSGYISRGGIAMAPTINGLDRFENDQDPDVVFVGCEGDFDSITIGEHIRVTYTENECYD